jgi:hypothetical protein
MLTMPLEIPPKALPTEEASRAKALKPSLKALRVGEVV